jgi:Fur family transcriptional regulator, zinc uptake regulator
MSHASDHNHAHCLKSAMKHAEEVCAAKGLQLTDTRRKVLAIIWSDHKALTAAEVMAALGNNQPPVTYRALEFLHKAGLIHHVASLNAYIGCPHPEHPHQSQLLICDSCHTVTEVSYPKLEAQLENMAKHHAFTVKEQHVEMLGRCADCRAA